MRNKVFASVLAVLVLFCTGWYYNQANDGFTLGGIFSEHAIVPQKSQPSGDEKFLDLSIFDQDFIYLGKGGQFYAFASQDGRHVLKFFRYKRFRHEPWLDYFDFIPFIDTYRLSRSEKKRQKLNKVIDSCEIAFNFLKESSGLELIHFAKTTNLNKTVKIIDKRGDSHFINLDEMEFIVQKKAQLLRAYIDDLMRLDQVVHAKNLLSSTVKMIYTESLKGVVDKDPAFMQNTGVFEGRPFHIDVGQVILDKEMMDPDRSHQEVVNKTFKLNRWLQSEYPELSQHLEAELELLKVIEA